MALIEYHIHYDDENETSKVTSRVLTVGVPDTIRFTSNDSKTAIQYVGGSPFDPLDPTAPQPDKVYLVGKKTKEFQVVRSITRANRLRFKCGEAVPAKKTSAAIVGDVQTKDISTLKFKPWKGSGGGTPPPDA